METTRRQARRDCWCGNRDLAVFAPDYELCRRCGTLVSQSGLENAGYLVQNDDTDFYGKQYWLSHQAEELGLPQIEQRARLDLPERCLHWLRHVLAYKLPPGKILELGCAHGGFVSLLRHSGFDATGLEMSPWVAALAQRTFDVPVLVGPVEQHSLPPASFDVIVANDVLEHLPDPLTTLSHGLRLLKGNAVAFIQMPHYPEGLTHAAMRAANHRFLLHMAEPTEHLYLYSKRAAAMLFERLGFPHVQFHEPVFDYDMYFTASRQPQTPRSFEETAGLLQTTPAGRLALALLDKAAENARIAAMWQDAETDRAARLKVITDIGVRLQHTHTQLAECDSDRRARLQSILQLERHLVASEMDRSARLQALAQLEQHIAAIDADRAARLQIILEQGELLTNQQDTIAAQRRALDFFHAAGFVKSPPLWKRVPKKLVKLLLPEAMRQKLRQRLRPWEAPRQSAPAAR